MVSRHSMFSEGTVDQPYTGVGIVAGFNGELYNLPELRRRLHMPAASEVEVFAEGYRRLGSEFLRLVDGQFAGFVFQSDEHCLTLIRDRFGISPMYWGQWDRTVVFGSNLAALSILGGGGMVSPEAITSLFSHFGLPTAGPIAERAQLLGPGALVRIDRQGNPQVQNWVETGQVLCSGSLDQNLDELLHHAVESRLRGGDCAIALSGGIDSTLVAFYASQHGVESSFGLADSAGVDSTASQCRVADGLGLRHHVVEVSPAELMREFEDFVTSRRTPLSRLGPVGMSLLARRINDSGFRGVLTGEGADELFYGYDAYRIELAKGGHFGSPDSLEWELMGDPEFRLASTSSSRHWKAVVGLSSGIGRELSPVARSLVDESVVTSTGELARGTGDPLHQAHRRRLRDIGGLLSGYLLLVQGDHAFMENRVESRPPMLANGVADWALSRTAEQEVVMRSGKLSLRRLLSLKKDRFGVPLSSYDRSKTAYRVDLDVIRGSDREWTRLLELARACSHPALRTEKIVDLGFRGSDREFIPEGVSMALVVCASLGLLGDSI